MKLYNSQGKNPLSKKAVKTLILNGSFLEAWIIVMEYLMNWEVDPWTLEVMLSRLEEDQDTIERKTLLLASRGLGKTTVSTIGFIITCILRDREMTIGLVSKTQTNARAITNVVKKYFEPGGKVHEVFGDLRGEPWRDEKFSLKRESTVIESTVEALSIESSPASKHFKMIIFDDIIDDASVATLNRRRKLLTRLEQTFLKATHRNNTIHFVGTHYHPDDVYVTYSKYKEAITGGLQYKTTKIPAIIEVNGEEYFSKKITKHQMSDILSTRENNPLSFFQQYQQVVAENDGDIFKKEWFQYYKDYKVFDNFIETYRLDKYEESMDQFGNVIEKPVYVRENTDVFIGVDLAISQKDTADNFVIAVIGVSNKSNIFLLDLFVGKKTYGEQIKLIKEFYNKWPMTKLIGIESNAYQSAMSDTLIEETLLPIEKMITKKDKVMRMNEFSAMWERGKVYIDPKVSHYKLLEDEVLSFPDAEHDDTIDAFYLAVETYREYVKKTPDYSYDDLLRWM